MTAENILKSYQESPEERPADSNVDLSLSPAAAAASPAVTLELFTIIISARNDLDLKSVCSTRFSDRKYLYKQQTH